MISRTSYGKSKKNPRTIHSPLWGLLWVIAGKRCDEFPNHGPLWKVEDVSNSKNVRKNAINYPPNHHFYGLYKPFPVWVLKRALFDPHYGVHILVFGECKHIKTSQLGAGVAE